MSLEKGSNIVLKDCLDVKEGEKLLIVTDDLRLNIGTALYEAGKNLGAESMLIVMRPRKVSGEEPPETIAKAMEKADVVVCPTTTSLTHTHAKLNAVKNGARVATMPGINEEMFSNGAITADYKEVEKLTLKITKLLTEGKSATIVKDGYKLTMSISGRDGVPSTGVYKNKGQSGNLPSGEAYIAPVEGSAEGETIIDGSMVGVGKLDEPLYVKLKKGRLIEIKGKDSGKLRILLENERNSNLAELGIGTNKNANLCGVILEDEKVYGTVHIAFGTNISFGGTVKADCHIDGIILNPDLYIDEKLVIKNGEYII